MYKQRIFDTAKPQFDTPLTQRGVRARVDHFYATGHILDLDNLLKCVLDGLTGAAYEDDSQVDEVIIRRYNVSIGHDIDNPLDEWLPLINREEEFVSIVVSTIEP